MGVTTEGRRRVSKRTLTWPSKGGKKFQDRSASVRGSGLGKGGGPSTVLKAFPVVRKGKVETRCGGHHLG